MNKRTIKFYVKSDAADVLPEPWRKHADYANYFQHRIIVGQSLWQVDDDEGKFTLLKCEHLRSVIPKSILTKLRDAMLDIGLIECDGDFVIGKKSLGYRLGHEFLNRPTLRISCRDELLAGRIKEIKRSEYKSYTKVHRYLLCWLKRVQVDLDGAFAMLAATPFPDRDSFTGEQVKEITKQALRCIKDREFGLIPCHYGRIHTNVTRLLAEAREFLHVDGEPLVNIDIANSQPLFLGMVVSKLLGLLSPVPPSSSVCIPVHPCYSSSHSSPVSCYEPPPSPLPIPPSYTMSSEGPSEAQAQAQQGGYDELKVSKHAYLFTAATNDDVPSEGWDVAEYFSLCERGHLYEELMHRLGWAGSRADFKAKEWFRFLYGRNHEDTPLIDLFRTDFPTMWEFIRSHKKAHGYKELSRQMQRDESKLMIENICGRLMSEHPEAPVVTIHDSIMTTSGHVDAVMRVMREEFRRIGANPTLTVDRGSMGERGAKQAAQRDRSDAA